MNEEDIDLVIDTVFKVKRFEKSGTEIETCDSKELVKYAQEKEDGGLIILEDPNQSEMNDTCIQAMFKQSKHNFSSVFMFS